MNPALSLRVFPGALFVGIVAAGCGPASKQLQNQPPLAVLVCAERADVGVPFSVDGTQSADIDGRIVSQQLLLDPLAAPLDGLTGTVIPTRPGPLTIALTLTDDDGATSDARCRVMVSGDVDAPADAGGADDTDPSGNPNDSTDPADADDAEGAHDSQNTAPPADAPPANEVPFGTATVRAYSVDCAFGWPVDWDDGSDQAELVIGFAWWSCGHEELFSAAATSNDFLAADALTGSLTALPGLADAPSLSSDVAIVYATRLIPPPEADEVRISVSGEDAVGVFARDSTVCEDDDDTEFCPVAVANGEWAYDILREERVGPQTTFPIEGPVDLELRAANADGAMSWSVTVELFAHGVRLDSAPVFHAR